MRLGTWSENGSCVCPRDSHLHPVPGTLEGCLMVECWLPATPRLPTAEGGSEWALLVLVFLSSPCSTKHEHPGDSVQPKHHKQPLLFGLETAMRVHLQSAFSLGIGPGKEPGIQLCECHWSVIPTNPQVCPHQGQKPGRRQGHSLGCYVGRNSICGEGNKTPDSGLPLASCREHDDKPSMAILPSQ